HGSGIGCPDPRAMNGNWFVACSGAPLKSNWNRQELWLTGIATSVLQSDALQSPTRGLVRFALCKYGLTKVPSFVPIKCIACSGWWRLRNSLFVQEVRMSLAIS